MCLMLCPCRLPIGCSLHWCCCEIAIIRWESWSWIFPQDAFKPFRCGMLQRSHLLRQNIRQTVQEKALGQTTLWSRVLHGRWGRCRSLSQRSAHRTSSDGKQLQPAICSSKAQRLWMSHVKFLPVDCHGKGTSAQVVLWTGSWGICCKQLS